ncbi:hypothetical protein [Halalkalicoccus sp. NIPERK01]|nr:hypothetical protein [Halalkalicoccus sp. NIPERK01]MDL5361307.1 hypothetical protein [Halalkalicoccus sp. NIPERK01]
MANPIEESLGEYFDQFGSSPMNATGLPGVTTPNGFGERGLPTAL